MSANLTDQFGRRIEYVRLSVTDRCDLRCTYCMPKGYKDFQVPEHWLTFDEIVRIMRAFASLGVRRVRITGGEPLVRHDLPDLVARLAAIPEMEDLSLSTNATRMERYAAPLRQAGIERINVSLDTLIASKFKQITQGKFEKVLNGLMAAKAEGFDPIKINMVVMKGVNDDEVDSMVEFCLYHGFTLRFIETMPMGETGREASHKYVDLQEIRQRLEKRYDLIPSVMPGGGPARYMRVAGTELRIGFITPISQHFCETCNRVRLSTDGTLYLCLGQEHKVEFRDLLRQGVSDVELQNAVIEAIGIKPERHEFKDKPDQVIRFMSHTGG